MSTDWVAKMGELGRAIASRAEGHDENDAFVADAYVKLREMGATAAGVPAELGGGGASHAELCAMVRELARHCGSTGLAFSMHTHLVATMAFTWRSGNKAPEGMLKRVAAEKLVLVSTGGSDWLDGSGTLERVDGGFRLTARKIFSSGCPAGDFLMTMGVYDDPETGPTVYHFPLSLRADGVKILDTWRALGMRGTGSHDVQIDGAFLPDAVMQGVKRAAGKWHPSMHAVVLAAFPVFYGAYLGVVERAKEIALGLAAKRKNDVATQMLAGELENLVVTAQLAHADMVRLTAERKPGPETTVAVSARRTILVNAILAAASKAMEVGGGQSFYRAAQLERCFRDVQGVRYHPIQEKTQVRLAGRHLLGLDLDA
ncbi:MAG TPA: acyl-CoA dehydrogenase family protein [Labilithrix sp.]